MKSHVTGLPANFCNNKRFGSNIPLLGISYFLYNGIPRNKPCPCGSGKKYKHCCALKISKPLTKHNKHLVLGTPGQGMGIANMKSLYAEVYPHECADVSPSLIPKDETDPKMLKLIINTFSNQ